MAAWYFCGLGLLRTSSAPPKAHNSAAASSRLTAFALASPGHDRIKTKSHDQFEADADNSHGPQRNARGHRHGAGLGLALALRGRRSAALTAARASSREHDGSFLPHRCRAGRRPHDVRQQNLKEMVPEVVIETTTYPLPRGCATTTLLRRPRGG